MGRDIARNIAKQAAERGTRKPRKEKTRLEKRFELTKNGVRSWALLGVGAPKALTISPKDFGKVRVDHRYQRGEIFSMVFNIWDALEQGGRCPGRIVLSDRLFKDDATEPKCFYVVDGQQRFVAHKAARIPILADIYKFESLEQERMAFILLNFTQNVNASSKVHSWPGEIAELLRTADQNEKAPLYRRVYFGVPDLNKGRPYYASMLAKGCVTVITGVAQGGNIQRVLSKGDEALAGMSRIWAKDVIDKYLRVATMVFNGSKVPHAPNVALARVAHRKWKDRGKMPTYASCRRIGQIDWAKLAPTAGACWLPRLEHEIEKRWKD